MVHRLRRSLVTLALLLPWVRPTEHLWAWSVTTHQIVAQQSVAQLPPGDQRDLLLQNQDYLRAGSLGPDLFYMPPMSGHGVFSDLAHYCKTNQLAGNMLSAAQSPKAKAFAYGWFSHNVTDSVAHPWVNGFTGQPYVDWNCGKDPRGCGLNSLHILIETWVDKQVFSEGQPNLSQRALQARSLVEAVAVYVVDREIQDLIIQAYNETYRTTNDCVGRKYRTAKLTRETIVKAARGMQGFIGGSKFGPIVKDIVDPNLIPFDPDIRKWLAEEAIRVLLRTWSDYIGRSKQYLAKAWPATGALRNFNLDQGVDLSRLEVGDVWGPVLDPQGQEVRVFRVPWHNYSNGEKPKYEDRCSGATGCDQPRSGPGGDNPDDAASNAPEALNTPDGSGEASVARVALKKGKRWPATLEALAREGDRVREIQDLDAFVQAFVALGEAYDRARELDPELRALSASYHGDLGVRDDNVDVAVLDNGFAESLSGLVEASGEPVARVSAGDVQGAMVGAHPAMLIPSGGLYGLSRSEQFGEALASYVSAGGTLVVFAQQRGSDFSVLPTPSGQPIRAWGWFEDNSCYYNGAYIDTFHPVLASQSQSLVTSAIDGYFDSIPENSIVLLRRVKNGMPAMFMYPYGQGWVIVTSSYDDWGGFNQSGPGARAIIRDAIAWAKKPVDLPLNAPGSTASISLHVKNITDLPASQVKLVLMSPSRDRVISEQTVGVAVGAGGTAEVSFSYPFPANAALGIYHLDYELLDGAGVVVQPVAEEDTGRIVVAKPPTGNPYRPADLTASVVMPGGEDVLAETEAVFRYRLKNNAAVERRFRVYYEFSHGALQLAEEEVLAGGAVVERDLSLVPRGERFWLHVFEVGGVPRPIWVYMAQVPADAGAYQLSDSKGMRLHRPQGQVWMTTDRLEYGVGETIIASVTASNSIALPWSGVVRVSRGDQLVFEQAVALPARGNWTGSFTDTAQLRHAYRITLERPTWAVAATGKSVAVIGPRLGSAGVESQWSRVRPSTVRWSIANRSAGQVSGGMLTAELRDVAGVVLWQGSQPFAMAGNSGSSFDFVLPALPASLRQATLALRASDGLGGSIQKLTEVDGVMWATVATDASSYSAGASGELIVRLINWGSIREEVEVGGSIEGLGILQAVAVVVEPGETRELRVPFTVPLDVRGGLHRGTLSVPHGPPVSFSVRVAPPELVFAVEDRPYAVGEPLPVLVRNTGGSRSSAQVTMWLGRDAVLARATAAVELTPGQETIINLDLPEQLASGPYGLSGMASDAANGVTARLDRVVTIAGVSATLEVATDQSLYVTGSEVVSSASLTNGPRALSGGLLFWELVRPCGASGGGGEGAGILGAAAPALASYHIETWDGTAWIERAVRHLGPRYETVLVDLAPYLPDPDGRYRARVRQTSNGEWAPALLDQAALLSGGGLISATSATTNEGHDVRAELLNPDGYAVQMPERSVEMEFPASPEPSLLLRGSEGETTCYPQMAWEETLPLDLPAGAPFGTSKTSQLWTPGQYVLQGRALNRDGAVVGESSHVFEVVSGEVSVSIGTDARWYRTGTSVTVSGAVRNQGAAAEPNLVLEVLRQAAWGGAETILSTPMSLDPGAEQAYSTSFEASQGEERVTARVVRQWWDTVAENNWSFKTGSPSLQVEVKLPDPRVKLAPTSPRLVVLERSDLDQVSTNGDDLEGPLPFPVSLPTTWGAVTYDRFRQTTSGFVELVPVSSSGPSGSTAFCLDGFDPWVTVLAAGLGELDLSGSGFVGYKLYAAGSQDRSGRGFPSDTVVFVWEAPGAGDPALRRFQVLLSGDGRVRFDADTLPGESGCARTGLVVPDTEVFSSSAPAPFGLRAETSVGRSPFEGRIQLKNAGSYPGSVDLDYGRVGGSRTTSTVTLAPGESQSLVFEDAITTTTTYSVVSSGDVSSTWEQEVVPSEGVRVEYRGEPTLTPGPVTLPLRVVKTGGVAGPVTVTYSLATSAGTSTLTRSYDLEPGFWSEDALTFEVPEGAVTLTAASDVPLIMSPTSLVAGPQERLAMTVTAGSTAGGRFPIGIDLVNSGLAPFSGEVQIEGGTTAPLPVLLPAGQTGHHDLEVDLLGQTPGPHTYVVRLVSEAGVVLSESTVAREVRPALVTLVSSPAGQSFDAGTLAELHFRLRNDGDQPTTGRFRFEVFDEPREAAFSLNPGAESEIVFELPLDPDVEQKVYAGRYLIDGGDGATVTGQVNFTVNGIALAVEASLDKDAYAEGDTAHFTVTVANSRPGLGTAYLVRVHYADFDETRPATIESSTSLVFDIPLPQVTGEALFLGITHPDGRSLYINTYHVRRSDALAQITLDRQVYAPGAAVVVSAASSATGTLTLSAPGYSETIPLSGSTSRSFSLASDLPGGTYFVGWSFTASDGESASGSVPFDVSGLRVRVFEARLAKGRYESGETIETTLRIHTNQPTSVALRAFVLDPEDLSQPAGETVVSLTPDEDLLATHSWPFSSAIAGLHRLVYGLYQGDTLLASGGMAFDVGSAAVLGVRTDKAEYPTPNDPVNVSVSAFVSGPASLRIEVDGETVATREVTATGIVEVPVTLDTLPTGPHTLTAVMEAGGYSSRRSTSFALGTSLPDLVAGSILARRVSGASWKLDASVSNAGRSPAPATDLILRNPATGASIGTAEVPSLAPGASATVSLDWNVMGAAGSREVEAVADATAAVLEFREDNNTSLTAVEIPGIVVDAVAQPAYPANVEASLGASVLNLTTDTTFAGLSITASVMRPDGSPVPLPAAALSPLAPGAEVFAGTPWAVGRSAPGTYALSSQVLDSAGASQATSSTYFQVLSTPAFSGTVTGTPNPVASGGTLSLAGHITNQGNVATEGTARFEVVDSGHAVVAQAEAPATVPLNGSTDVSASSAPLEVPPGDYSLDLRVALTDQTYPVASTPLAVTGQTIEATLGPDLTPRVLVYVGGAPWDAAGRARRTAFVQASLAGSGAFVKTTSDPLEFARLFRSGTWNTHVVMTDVPLLLPLLADELREAVFRGDGLVLVQWRTGSTPALESALGARIQGHLPGSNHTLSVLDGPLGPAETIVVPNLAAKLTLSGAVLAGTMDGRHPALTVNEFGAGRSATMAFDPGVTAQDPASASLRGLFARAVAYAALRQPRFEAPGTVQPLAVSLRNPASTDQEVEVTLTLPFGVTLASADDGPLTQEPPAWRVTVAAGTTNLLRFQVVAPDAVGTFVITSAVKVGGVAISNPPSFTIEVPRTTDQTLADVIAVLEGTAVSPPDQGHLQAAISLLRVAQATGTDLLGLEARIRLAADAAEKLGRIQSADVTAPRRTVTQLVAAWERASFGLMSAQTARASSGVRAAALLAKEREAGGSPVR